MKLSSSQANKVDPALRQALEQAEGHESLRTVMIVGSEKPAKAENLPAPSGFPDRVAYRKALIETKQKQILAELSTVKSELAGRSLRVKGGTTSRAVVVEGAAGDILSSLDLPDVHHASLDHKISIDKSKR
jgi:hypothetical protein